MGSVSGSGSIRAVRENLYFDDLIRRWDLDAVYRLMNCHLQADIPLMNEIFDHLLGTRGKGIRPLLVLICSAFGKRRKCGAAKLAAGLELLHMATLVHDDIIDGAAIRRNRLTINAKWGLSPAVLTGDFLYGKSLELVQAFGHEAVGRLSWIIEELVTGEFLQAEGLFDTELGLTGYVRRVRKKTAAFFSQCCALGALAGGADDHTVRLLERFGRFLGTGFQIYDDILDWIVSEKKAGKPVTHDLQQGVMTLPVLAAVRMSPRNNEIISLINRRRFSRKEIEWMHSEIMSSGAMAFSQRAAAGYCGRAEKYLKAFAPCRPREDLLMLVKILMSSVEDC